MSGNRGRRFEDTSPKLNKKKVVALILAVVVLIMIIISLKNLLTTTGNTGKVSALTTYISVYKDNKWGVIDNSGKIIIEPTYDEMIIVPNKNKDIFICVYDVNYENSTYKTKVLNKSGKEILENYNLVEAIENQKNNEVWHEDDVLKFERNGKYGLINFKGKEILKPEYTKIYALQGTEKTIVLENENGKGIFSTVSNDIVVEVKYSEITSINDNYENGYIVKNLNNKCGIIGNDKKVILEEKYSEIKNIESKDYAVVIENEGEPIKVINKNGETLLQSGFDSIEKVNSDEFIIIKDGKYGVIDKTGKEVIPNSYEDIKPSFLGYYIAKKDGKYGVINAKDNTTKIEFQYENINYIKETDFLQAEKDNYTTDIIDRNFDKKLEEVIVSDINVKGGYFRIRKDGNYKYYNFKFEEKENREVLLGNTLFLIKENGKYGYINKAGEKVVDTKYDDAKEQNEFGYSAVKLDGKWGVLKDNGSVLMEPSVDLEENLYIDFIGEFHKHKDLSLNVYTK